MKRRIMQSRTSVSTVAFAAAAAIALTSCGMFSSTAPAEWVLREPPEGQALQLQVGIGRPCNELRPLDVEETSGSVTIRASVELGSGECVDMFDVRDVDVTLNEVLGDRELRGCTADGDESIQLEAPNPDCRRLNQ